MKKNLNFFLPNEVRAFWRFRELMAIRNVLKSATFIKGQQNILFEEKFKNYIGCNYLLAVNSGTDALIIGLMSLGINIGDEVIVPSHTATATISAVVAVGAIPVFVDVNPDDFTLDFHQVKKAVTIKTRALIAVHIYGQPCDLDNLKKLCSDNDIYLVEDCAQATGAEFQGQKVGSFGDIAAFSFYPTKNLGAIGDAGALAIKRKNHFDSAIKIAQYGWNGNRISEVNGINSRMDEIQASILVRKIAYLDKWNQKRREIAEYYLKNLDPSKYILPSVRDNSTHVFHLFVIRSEKRDEVMASCLREGIALGIHYQVPNHCHPTFEKFSSKSMELRHTELIANTIISLPLYPEISKKKVQRICEVLNDI